jgi:phosphoribosylformylglycinamidine cyclo-ligase
MSEVPTPGGKPSLSHGDAGADIDTSGALVQRIEPLAAATARPGVRGGIRALVNLPWGRDRQPVLLSGTDGERTEVKLAGELGRHQGIGIDLVAMSVNNIQVAWAGPLRFPEGGTCPPGRAPDR